MTTTEPLRGARTRRPATALAPLPSLRKTTSTKTNLALSAPSSTTEPRDRSRKANSRHGRGEQTLPSSSPVFVGRADAPLELPGLRREGRRSTRASRSSSGGGRTLPSSSANRGRGEGGRSPRAPRDTALAPFPP